LLVPPLSRFLKEHDIDELLHLMPASIKVPLAAEKRGQLILYATPPAIPPFRAGLH